MQWWVWVAVGLPVMVLSAFLDLALFVWIGAVFLVVGTAQLVFLFVLAPRKEKVVPERFFCPRCRLTVKKEDNFCSFCGQRLR